ncbi:MAG: hypothetical protein AB7O24_16560 [Kofleriaceae bacterium]
MVAASSGRWLLAVLAVTRVIGSAVADTPHVLYLNRCAADCVIARGASDDAAAHVSTLVRGGNTAVISEFSLGEPAWSELVHCVREAYSPYAITVTTELPAAGTLYNEVIVGGIAAELGRSGTAGVSPISDDCTPLGNVMSFAFANQYAPDNVLGLCWAVSQESGHAFGLDHAYELSDGSSACTDVMSYRADCAVQRFFRNNWARCGEDTRRACRCGGKQNAHAKLLGELGPSTPTTAPPTVEIVERLDLDPYPEGVVFVVAGGGRGIDTLELWLNDYPWVIETGVGSRPAADDMYQLVIPSNVPPGITNVVAIARDDLGAAASSQGMTLTIGQPCAADQQCLYGQHCSDGGCRWDPPAGEVGDWCDHPQACKSRICRRSFSDGYCSMSCDPETDQRCPASFECASDGGSSICLRPGDTPSSGCAAAAPAPGAAWLVVFGLTLRRRRRAARS